MKARTIFVAVLVVFGVCVSAWAGWSTPVPVGEVNTAYIDKTPFLSFDGLTLYFCRLDTDTFYYTRIFQATRPEPYGPFTSVQNISELNYSGGHVSSPWVSPDNLRMYYYRTEPGSRWRLKVTERSSIYDSWQPGVNISELNALGHLYDLSLTEDELTIVFSGWSLPGNIGEYDLWIATRPDRYSPFGNARNLTEINTAASEGLPYISPDGLTLYFYSNRNGLGQIFRATRSSLSEPFGNLEHLSFFDDPGGVSYPALSSDGSTFFYVQLRDIYVSYLIEDPYELAVMRIEDAIVEKVKALERIDASLEKEWAAYEALDELLESGDYGDLKKGDIIKAMQTIHSAIQHQELSRKALEKSIEKLLYSLSALGYGPQPPGSNWPPNVTITKPQNGAEFNPDQKVEIEADAWDYDGSVVMVEFFADGSKIGEDNDGSDGWTTDWYEHPVGTYSLTARATDDEGAATTSAAVGIRVAEEPPPPPPPPPPIPPPPPRP